MSDLDHLVVLTQMKSNTGARLPDPSGRSSGQALPRPPQRRRLTARDRGNIVELYDSGESTRSIAIQMELGRTTVLNALKSEGVQLRPRGNYVGRRAAPADKSPAVEPPLRKDGS